MTIRTTLKQANRAIAKAGIPLELERGEGKAFYARADEIGFIEALYELTEREELFRNLEI